MKKSKINNSVIEEAQHRIESLTKGLTKPELKSFKKDLMQLKISYVAKIKILSLIFIILQNYKKKFLVTYKMFCRIIRI